MRAIDVMRGHASYPGDDVLDQVLTQGTGLVRPMAFRTLHYLNSTARASVEVGSGLYNLKEANSDSDLLILTDPDDPNLRDIQLIIGDLDVRISSAANFTARLYDSIPNDVDVLHANPGLEYIDPSLKYLFLGMSFNPYTYTHRQRQLATKNLNLVYDPKNTKDVRKLVKLLLRSYCLNCKVYSDQGGYVSTFDPFERDRFLFAVDNIFWAVKDGAIKDAEQLHQVLLATAPDIVD